MVSFNDEFNFFKVRLLLFNFLFDSIKFLFIYVLFLFGLYNYFGCLIGLRFLVIEIGFFLVIERGWLD